MAPAAAVPFRRSGSVCNGLPELARLKTTEFLYVGCRYNAEETDCEEADIALADGVPLNGYSDVPEPWINGDDVVSMEAEQSLEDCAASDSSSVGCPVDDLSSSDIELISRSSAVVNDVSVPSALDPRGVGDDCEHDLVELGDVGGMAPNSSRRRRNSLTSECALSWGCMSICGRRPEMEDAANAVLRFSEIPHQLLTAESVSEGGSGHRSVHPMAHFFGVYDGHGGAQVANYCKERIHGALVEEFQNLGQVEGSSSDDMSKRWLRVFTECFNKVDAEVAGERMPVSSDDSVGQFSAIAPETVGSTAVVAVVSSSHIVVANCGDSRAVLSRGKQPVPLSSDHKPNRDDEYARIEAAGGKVIQWNGYRVMGVLAMSRSIGDRYLKPWVISEPEVMCVPRTKEDECLILASDGLWDVLSNEEACETARKRIQLWHKKNNGSSSGGGDDGTNPAAQAAADYLTKLALHRGSKDNITVVVIDLKARWKFKTRT